MDRGANGIPNYKDLILYDVIVILSNENCWLQCQDVLIFPNVELCLK